MVMPQVGQDLLQKAHTLNIKTFIFIDIKKTQHQTVRANISPHINKKEIHQYHDVKHETCLTMYYTDSPTCFVAQAASSRLQNLCLVPAGSVGPQETQTPTAHIIGVFIHWSSPLVQPIRFPRKYLPYDIPAIALIGFLLILLSVQLLSVVTSVQTRFGSADSTNTHCSGICWLYCQYRSRHQSLKQRTCPLNVNVNFPLRKF